MELYSWVLPAVAVIAYVVGILTEKFLSRPNTAGEILVDIEGCKVMLNFSIMPEDLSGMKYILMEVKQVSLVNTNDSSDSDEH